MSESSMILTPREREILVCRCAEELTLTETARRLGIGRNTANALSDRAYKRLGVSSIAGACFRLGLRGAHLAAVARREVRGMSAPPAPPAAHPHELKVRLEGEATDTTAALTGILLGIGQRYEGAIVSGSVVVQSLDSFTLRITWQTASVGQTVSYGEEGASDPGSATGERAEDEGR